jgi:heme oxygenase
MGDKAEGRLFYRGAPSDQRRWRRLCQQLEAEGSNHKAMEEMIIGAQRAFGLFEQLLLPHPAHA